MAFFPSRNLNQTCVYWGTPTASGYGAFTYATPVELDCRWLQVREVITDNNGDEIVSHSRVRVAQDVDEEGVLYLGALDDLTVAQKANPLKVDNAFKIRKFDKKPTMRKGSAQRVFRKAWL